jgi:hypothetical protein
MRWKIFDEAITGAGSATKASPSTTSASTAMARWDPADDGSGHLIATLHRQGIKAVGSGSDFLSITEPPMVGAV